MTPDKTYPGFEITMNGRFVRLATNFSLIVESDGEWISVVRIPLKYSSIMEGICGDSNQYDNDCFLISIVFSVKYVYRCYVLLSGKYVNNNNNNNNNK